MEAIGMQASRRETLFLRERLDRIERQNRWLKVVALLMAAGLSLFALLGAAGNMQTPKSIEAEQFLLRGADGTVVAKLGQFEAGPGLALMDTTGEVRAGIIVTDAGPSISLFDADGQRRLELRNDAETARVSVYDRKGTLRSVFGMNGEDHPYFIIRDAEARNRAVLGSTETETGLVFYDLAGKPRHFSGLNDGHPLLVFKDGEGTVRATLASTDESSEFLLGDKTGTTRVKLAMDATEPSLVLRDAAGNPRAVLVSGTQETDLALFDAEGRQRAVLATDATGQPVLIFRDAAMQDRAVLSTDEAEASLELFDAHGHAADSVRVGPMSTTPPGMDETPIAADARIIVEPTGVE
jgi:hypothetical protein